MAKRAGHGALLGFEATSTSKQPSLRTKLTGEVVPAPVGSQRIVMLGERHRRRLSGGC